MTRTEIVTLLVEHDVATTADSWDWSRGMEPAVRSLIHSVKVLGHVEAEADVEVGDPPTLVPGEFEAKGVAVGTVVYDDEGDQFVKSDTDDMCWIYICGGRGPQPRTKASWYTYKDLAYPLTVLYSP